MTDWDTAPPARSADDADYVLRRAQAIWKERLAAAPDTLLDADTERTLERFMARRLN